MYASCNPISSGLPALATSVAMAPARAGKLFATTEANAAAAVIGSGDANSGSVSAPI
jgi:hypothetical protein